MKILSSVSIVSTLTIKSIFATAKAAKNTFYAYNMGLIDQANAELIITSIADKFINTVPKGPSGFIENGHFPLVCSGVDRWGNDWDDYRAKAADKQINWYSSINPFLDAAELFGLSAAESPEGACFVYGTGGVGVSEGDDGDGEIVVLHYCGLISDIRETEAKNMWEVLQNCNETKFPGIKDKIVFSPLNNMESMRVDKTSGDITGISRLKGGCNIALHAEGWALPDLENRGALFQAIQNNAFLLQGYDSLIRSEPNFLENNIEKQIVLFPNPTSGNFIIDLGQKYMDVVIEVSNLLGQNIIVEKQQILQSVTMEINDGPGTYLVRIRLGKERLAVIRLIKKKVCQHLGCNSRTAA